MKVNIVCRRPESDTVLSRLARALSAETGYRISESPDRGADLNYFQCYIEYAERFSDWRYTPVAAYFSHYETGSPHKEFWWNSIINMVGLRMTTAEIYTRMCEPHGLTRQARVPIDPQFKIMEHKPNDRPRIGFAGYIAQGGRKGERLAARLSGSHEGKWDIVATGRGWPVRVQHERTFAELPKYFNSLDVYVSTAHIEGVPMPPLEALACGVPVVIPSGVGLHDELNGAGVYHYPIGDYDSMVEAIERALQERVSREDMRSGVSHYSQENWAADHVAAFEEVLGRGNNKAQERSIHGERGAYYVAFGDPSRRCANAAIQSFKQFMPNIPVALVSDRPLGPEDLLIQADDADIGGRIAKIRIDDLAPMNWEYILYLDADTEITADISFLFDVLEDGWDTVICRNPSKYHLARWMIRPDNKDECEETWELWGTDEILQLNGGVFGFARNPRTKAFFKLWLKEWQLHGKRDQGALLRALHANPLKLYVLGNEWNTITRYADAETSAGILHYPMTARRWRGKIAGRIDSDEAWQAVERFSRGQA